ncbi:L7Ae/L30e/S12e/Gadd45 family ribosomal protein [Mitsuokella sp. WILCCON 0060]|uniref:L7Ae/L30e/S12e/Gadd45 family ribosomal protein n=1 Tax=unclassified Mitsuokella TaxID=2637239 RepID=UPI003EFCDFB8
MAVTKEQRIMNLLSMAQRARRIVSGAFAVEQALKARQAVLVLMAADASAESKKNYQILADRYKVPYLEGLDRAMLGQCLGKEYRAVAALLDEGFAKKLCELMKEP